MLNQLCIQAHSSSLRCGGSLCTVRNDNRACAFTLAEVLITLTIIGVIAALTIPNLLQKYQDEALKTAYKKTYNVLNNAYKTVIAETGPLDCNYIQVGNMKYGSSAGTDCNLLYEKLFGNALKIVKQCKNYAAQNGCLPENGYKDGKDILMESGKTEEEATTYVTSGCAAIKKRNIDISLPVRILSDGQILIGSGNILFVDINGKKGPNKWGYDLFEFDIWQDKSGNTTFIPGGTSCVIKEKGGKTPTEMYRSVILNK